MWFERVGLEAVEGWTIEDENVVGTGPVKESIFSEKTALMQPQDMRQYVYTMMPISIPSFPAVHTPGSIIPLGRLDISWRSSFGEPGRLLTSVCIFLSRCPSVSHISLRCFPVASLYSPPSKRHPQYLRIFNVTQRPHQEYHLDPALHNMPHRLPALQPSDQAHHSAVGQAHHQYLLAPNHLGPFQLPHPKSYCPLQLDHPILKSTSSSVIFPASLSLFRSLLQSRVNSVSPLQCRLLAATVDQYTESFRSSCSMFSLGVFILHPYPRLKEW